ncbi:MAG: ABC transporter substrate-binding protein [Treponemataceae bacterium]|nr:ABC transporter substrate-binding protein [Treponemataceae bacterium]
MKKMVLVVLALLMAFSVLYAGGKKEVKAEDEPITLRIAWWGSQKRHDATLAVLDLYTKKTGVQFEAEPLPFDGYFAKLNTLAAANDVWDIIQLGSNFPTYLDVLEPLDSYVERGLIDVSGTSAGTMSTTRLNGNGALYGISLGTNTYGIAYDPALFAAAGVAEPAENWTWADYEKAAMTIHEKLGIFGSSKLDDFISGASIRVPQHDENASLFAPEGNKLGYDDDYPIEDYWAIRKRLVDAGAYPDPGRINEIKDIEGDFLVRGEAAMTFLASNQFVALCSAAGRPLKMATLPRESADGPIGATMQSSQQFSMFNGSKYKDEVAKFLSFFVNDIEANRILNAERGNPIMAPVLNDLEKSADDVKKELYSFMAVMTKLSSIALNFDVPKQEEIKDLYWRIEDQVVFGKYTPAEGAKQFRKEAEAIFAK